MSRLARFARRTSRTVVRLVSNSAPPAPSTTVDLTSNAMPGHHVVRPGAETTRRSTPSLRYGARHDRLPGREPGQLGRSGTGARRLRRTTTSSASPTDPAHLSDVVTFDLPLLGDIAGLRGVHLQCHIGTDTVSLARLGATMTGARLLAEVAGAGAAARRAGRHAGRVRRVGRLRRGRRPRRRDSSTWSTPASARSAGCPTSGAGRETVAALLRPGGRLFIREGHPVLWSLRATSGPTACWSLDVPVLRAEGAADLERGRHLRRHRRASSRTTPRTSGTTASARSSPRCWTPA